MKNYKHIKVDLSNCDKEPIQLIGRIQAHGFLVIADRNTFTSKQVSENIGKLTGVAAEQCLNQSLEQLFSSAALGEITAVLETQAPFAPFPVSIRAKDFICFANLSGDQILLEFEPLPNHWAAILSQLHTYLTKAIGIIGRQETLLEISAQVTESIQQLLDYDRVMIYQFDQDWHGNVIAEKVKPGVKSYYNHHFPASDIPQQARAMLVEKGIRQITDVSSESVEIVPYFNPASGAPTDIIASELRNPSEIHLEYLKNMEVGASISIAILVKGKLWGLVCCQHHSPLFIDYYRRNTAQLITHLYATSILSARETQDKHLIEKYTSVEKRLIEQMEENLDIIEGLFHGAVTLLDLSEATGAAIILEDQITTTGQCPEEDEIRGIIEWASRQELSRVFITREFHKHYPPAFAFRELASGVMITELSKHNREYLLCFKPEIRETISWAGNPDKSLQMDGQHKLHPRKSFEKWEQEIQGKSAPWSALEVERANSVAKSVVSIQLKCQAEKLRKLNTQLEEALQQLEFKNSQLEDFTRIASHNLFSPLNNLTALVKLYQKKGDFVTAQVVLEQINTVAENMRETLQDLHQILEVSTAQELPKDHVDIRKVIEKEKQSLTSQIQQTGAAIEMVIEAPVIIYPKVYLESIVHNFLSNALKYASPERKPHITIKTWEEKDQIFLQFNDNGLGIDLEKHGAKLFGLYKTFHRNEDSRGLGLYLVKKQVEALGGRIEVSSQEGQGSRFTVRLKRFA